MPPLGPYFIRRQSLVGHRPGWHSQGYALVLPPSEGRPILRELITLEPTIKRPFLDYLAATLAGVSWSTTAEIASASVDINHTQQLCPENGAEN